MTDGGGKEEFVSEAITPQAATADVTAMSRGEAGLPELFTWRDVQYRVVAVIDKWKSSGPCRSGGGEMYLRRHWYRVLTDPPMIMTIYCERQVRNSKRPKARWWVYTVEAVKG